MPIGDLAGSILTLVVAYPQIHWLFRYTVVLPNGEEEFLFDDKPIKESLEDVPLCEPEVLSYLRVLLENGVSDIEKYTDEAVRI
jgi:hypothetical protein